MTHEEPPTGEKLADGGPLRLGALSDGTDPLDWGPLLKWFGQDLAAASPG
jgi:hypothetical protein